MSKLPEWEIIFAYETEQSIRITRRLKVFGGWMVNNLQHTNICSEIVSESSIFVPDTNHEWVL